MMHVQKNIKEKKRFDFVRVSEEVQKIITANMLAY
jgi:hypothetical protein